MLSKLIAYLVLGLAGLTFLALLYWLRLYLAVLGIMLWFGFTIFVIVATIEWAIDTVFDS